MTKPTEGKGIKENKKGWYTKIVRSTEVPKLYFSGLPEDLHGGFVCIPCLHKYCDITNCQCECHKKL